MRAELVAVARLDAATRGEMYLLFDRHFEGIDEVTFAADLAAKHWALVLRDDEGVAGFTSFRHDRWRRSAGNDGLAVVSSGDTVVAPRAWAASALAPCWIRSVTEVHRRAGGGELYWLLIVSGFRTYRFLPTFFRDFYPRHDRATPPQTRRAIARAARRLYGERYLGDRGIVRFARPQVLRPELRAVPPGRERDPHVRFFARANPGAARGDELVCWTRVDDANLTRAGRRMVERGARGVEFRHVPGSLPPAPSPAGLPLAGAR